MCYRSQHFTDQPGGTAHVLIDAALVFGYRTQQETGVLQKIEVIFEELAPSLPLVTVEREFVG